MVLFCSCDSNTKNYTPAQVKEQIASIQNDPKFYDTENLERPAMVRKMQNLMEELHGTTQTQSISIG